VGEKENFSPFLLSKEELMRLKGIILLIFLSLIQLILSNTETKVYLLDVSKGEKPNSKLVEKEDLSLSDKFIADFEIVNEKIDNQEKWLKVVFSKGGEENLPYGKCKFGVNRPKISDWSSWEKIKFTVYNPNNRIVILDFSLRDKEHPFSYAGRFDTSVVIPAGKSKQEIFLQGITNNNREPFNIKNIFEWYFAIHNLSEETVLYFGDIELTNE
jgi:hypothetical protein